MPEPMNSRERIQTILRKEVPDRMGLYEFPWPETFRAWVKEGYPTEDDGETPLPLHDVFEIDFEMPWVFLDAMPRRGVNEVIEETDEWKLVRKGDGSVTRTWKNKCGTPEHVSF